MYFLNPNPEFAPLIRSTIKPARLIAIANMPNNKKPKMARIECGIDVEFIAKMELTSLFKIFKSDGRLRKNLQTTVFFLEKQA